MLQELLLDQNRFDLEATREGLLEEVTFGRTLTMHEIVLGKGGLGHYGYREEKSQRHRQEKGGQAGSG